MSTLAHITRKDCESILSKSFPSYTGNKFKVEVSETYRMSNYWDGGSRDYVVILDSALNPVHAPDYTANPFNPAAHSEFTIPQGFMVVEHSYFMGRDAGITFILPPNSPFLPKMLPEKPSVPHPVVVAVYVARSYKSSYQGRNIREEYAIREGKISREEYLAGKETAIREGYLNKAGAVTVAGKNLVANMYHCPKGE